MNQSEARTGEVTKRVVEYEVRDADDVLRGVTLDSRRLVVAGGARLVRVVPLTGRVIDQLETFPGPGGLAYDGRHLWQHVEGRFEQLDMRTGLTVRSINPGLDGVTGLECFEGGLLVLHDGGRCLARVEIVPHRGGIIAEDVATGAPLRGLAWSRGRAVDLHARRAPRHGSVLGPHRRAPPPARRGAALRPRRRCPRAPVVRRRRESHGARVHAAELDGMAAAPAPGVADRRAPPGARPLRDDAGLLRRDPGRVGAADVRAPPRPDSTSATPPSGPSRWPSSSGRASGPRCTSFTSPSTAPTTSFSRASAA